MKPLALTTIACIVLCTAPKLACAAPDVSGKVVLANLDRYDAFCVSARQGARSSRGRRRFLHRNNTR